jgi:uroporphyrinogen-III synthase
MDAPARTPADMLRGFRIGVTSDRRSADLIAALERRGAQVLHAPALTIVPNDHDDSLVAETRRLIAARPEVVLVTTGYGMRRWLEVADAAGLGAELTAALEAARIFARGPKAHGAVRAAGLLAWTPRHRWWTRRSQRDCVVAEWLCSSTGIPTRPH